MSNLPSVLRNVSNLTGIRPSFTQLLDLPRSCSPKLCLYKESEDKSADKDSQHHSPYTSKRTTAAIYQQRPLWPRQTLRKKRMHRRPSCPLSDSTPAYPRIEVHSVTLV